LGLSIWHRIDALTGVDPNVDLKKTVDSRVAFTYSVILAVMAWLNAAMLHLSGDGRPGMVWIGMIAGTVALACGALGVWTKRPHLTMALILVFAVALYTPSAWGNRGFLPPSAIYLPGILLGFYLVWGARSLFVLGPLILGFLAYIYFLGDQYPAEGEWPLTALIVALAFACIWVSFIGSIFRSASQQAAAEMTRVNTELATALDAANAGSRAKTDFLANMGHEVRTPLNGVLGMTNVLLNDGVISDLQRERLTLIEESGKALHEMLNDILDLSKIEAGRLELETTEFDLPALVHSISGLWAAPAEANPALR
jgi:signal transduction histidine kinase